MADITISDLELAPALADDMVFPVENTTDTYAATLAMLRRLLNKTFVEVENADFNNLMDDGFYQCTGTPTNSPVAGAINWTLQVSAESGVIVQRAFSLDDNFANLYIRRWNGVTWTAWIEVGAGTLNNKANISLSNIDATGQAKFDAKANISLSNIDATGQAKFDAKANISLSNIDATGQAKFDAKANTEASNFTEAGKQNIVSLNNPDYSAGITGTLPFTAPKSGKISVNLSSVSNNDTVLHINGVIVGYIRNANGGGVICMPQFDVSGGDVVTASGGYQAYSYYYFPCKGV